MTQDLHRVAIAHGDLQHENILVNQYGKIFLIDYDSMYIPEESFSKAKNTTNGKDGYQHPLRANCVYAGKKLDYFSEVVILTSIIAIAYKPELIKKYDFATVIPCGIMVPQPNSATLVFNIPGIGKLFA